MSVEQKSAVEAVLPPTRRMLRRILVLMAVFGLGAAALLLARLCRLQLGEHDR